jgi:hypothetical protein
MHRRPLRHWRTQDRKTRGLDVPLHIQQLAEVVDPLRIDNTDLITFYQRFGHLAGAVQKDFCQWT